MAATDGDVDGTFKIIWDRRQQGDLVADIGHDLGFTPVEVLDILRAEKMRRAAEPVNPG
jgi:hypothetical protein